MDKGKLQSAAAVDPASIQNRALCASGTELLVRRRPPGGVNLARGQREHMLMTSVGHQVLGRPVRSVLRTDDGERRWTSCPRGHVTYVPAGFPMEWEWSYASESVHLTMPTAFVDEIGEQLGRPVREYAPPRPAFRILHQTLAGLLQQLRVEAEDTSLGRDLATSSLLTLIGVQVYRLSGGLPAMLEEADGFSAQDRQRSIEMLRDRLDEKIPIAELAAEFDLSPFYFARVFKRATGFPPHQFQIQLRVERARALLRGTRRTVADIACEVGFADESHLRRHFRRIVGTTPSRYRSQQ